MPNHITNVLHIEGENSEKIFESIKGDKDCIDFNAIVEMPEILRADSSESFLEDLAILFCGGYPIREFFGTPVNGGIEAFKRGDYGAAADHLKKQNLLRALLETKLAGDLDDDRFETLIKYMRAYRKTGFCSWFEWSRANWGTKWNAYEQVRIDDRTIKFETAWSTPGKIWEKLSEMFPSNVLAIRWADEDFGCNTGAMRVQNGNVLDGGPFENNSAKAYKNAVELLYDGELPEYYRWKEDGTAEYVEENE